MHESFFKIQTKRKICILFFILMMYLLGVETALSQPHQPVFSFVREVRSVRNPKGLLSGDFNGDKIPDLTSFSNNQIFLHFQKKNAIDWKTVPLRLELNLTSLAVARFDADAKWDFALLEDAPPKLEVYLLGAEEQPMLSWSTNLHRTYEQIVVGDINFDGKTDILLYGRKNLGVSVFLGTGNGLFHESDKLFTEYTFSNVKLTDFNNDGQTDVAAIDWVENRVFIFTSYGKMKFREPVILHFDDEPIRLTTAYLDTNSYIDLAVALDNKREIHTFVSDGRGDFTSMQTLQMAFPPVEIATDKFAPDEDSLLVTLMTQGEQISLVPIQNGVHSNREMLLATGNSPLSMCLFAYQQTRFKNLAIINQQQNRIRIYYNTNIPPPKENAMTYAAGYKPNDVVSFLMPNMERFGIIVSHSFNNFLTLYQQSDDGTFNGPYQLRATSLSGNISLFQKNDSTLMLVGEHTIDDHISFIEISSHTLTTKVNSFPSHHAQIIASTFKQTTGSLNLLALEEEPTTQRRNVVLFDQVTSNRFSEQQINTIPSTDLLTATGTFYSNAIHIWYASLNQRKKKLEVYSTFSVGGKDFSQSQLVFDVSSEPVTKGFLWNRDFNGDGIEDFLLLQGEPLDTLLVFVSLNKTKYVSAQMPQPNRVNIASREKLKFFDVDGDRFIDIVLDNSITKTIEVYTGNRDGTFDTPYRLISSEGLGGFTFSDVNGDSSLDLIVTDAANGYVKVITFSAQEE